MKQTDQVPRENWIKDERLSRIAMHRSRRRGIAGVERRETRRSAVRCVEYLPTGGPRAWIVWLHGGGWVFGEPEGDEGMLVTWVSATGCAVSAVDYALAPEHPYPAALDDATMVVEDLIREAPGLPVVVAGASAGATLAAGLCLRQRDRRRPLPDGQLLICPPLEDDNLESDLGPLSRNAMQTFWKLWAGEGDLDVYATPGKVKDFRGLPPAHIFTTSADPLRLEGWRYATNLAAAGVDVEAQFVAGGYHGFEYEAPETKFSRDASDRWAEGLRRLVERASAGRGSQSVAN
ncbi:alpha/beta hydrolase [Tessaracoccus sp. OS52]|uniref:alpha/beta hydrolase n=1 Tax=Tessaracoccus sp. OS52 TaxID=2886691 RepID=UPI001D124EC5|nr:alpha/beta hydrolase [Tessaracoccus sp. OS52]MCC2591861.1 alpha/beta hydrolase [Tessaracoccus sp. OS52]